jgi:8-oxo-dGTP diphosphatase
MYQSFKYNDSRPNVGVTVVPFIFEDGIIKTLVYTRSSDAEVFAGQYCLPNAIFAVKNPNPFAFKDTNVSVDDTSPDEPKTFKSLEEAAEFALLEKTSVKLNHIEQLHTFSGLYIDPDRINTVNVSYFSICNRNDIETVGESKFEFQWISVETLMNKKLAFNHNEVLEMAYSRLKAKAEYTALTAHLLGNSFTIAEFKKLIELLIDIKLDNSRFRDRIKKSDVLIPLNNEFSTGSHRPAQLYKLNEDYKDFFYPASLTKPN